MPHLKRRDERASANAYFLAFFAAGSFSLLRPSISLAVMILENVSLKWASCRPPCRPPRATWMALPQLLILSVAGGAGRRVGGTTRK